MWLEERGLQTRLYYRTATRKDYVVVANKEEGRELRELCKQFGQDRVLAEYRGRTPGVPASPPRTAPPSVLPEATMPRLAAGLLRPAAIGVTLRWLGEQYVESGNRGNDNTRSDYRRDLERYIYPFFCGGDVDIALVMTRPLPTEDGSEWPVPTVAKWKEWLKTRPKHDRHGKPVPGTLIADKTRRNLESLLAQVFNFALAFDPQPLLGRNPCTSLGLTRVDSEECVWLERVAAELVVASIDPYFRVLVQFLLGTGVRWGEAAALQAKDVHLGDGTEQDPPWIYVHKTWKKIGKRSKRTKRQSKYVWGRGRTKTRAGRRRITLTQALANELRPFVVDRDPRAAVFTMKKGGVLHNGNFTDRYLKPAIETARQTLRELRATASPAELRTLPDHIPDFRPHAFRHSHAAYLLSAGRPELEVQLRLGHADGATTRKLYGHLTREVTRETVRFLEDFLAPLMTIGLATTITAETDPALEQSTDAEDSLLPLVDAEEDDELAAMAAA